MRKRERGGQTSIDIKLICLIIRDVNIMTLVQIQLLMQDDGDTVKHSRNILVQNLIKIIFTSLFLVQYLFCLIYHPTTVTASSLQA